MNCSKLYSLLIAYRKTNPLEQSDDLYTEEHHIVPSCMGGSDEPENLIRLTAREHFIAHKLLSKIYPQERRLQMAFASFLMRRHSKGVVKTSLDYERLRIIVAKQCSIRMKEYYSDPSNLKLMSERSRKMHESLDHKEKMRRSCYENEEVRNKISSASLLQWESQEHRNNVSRKNSERGLEIWEDPDYASRHFEGRKKFFEANTMPWQRPRGIPTMVYWGLAQFCWKLSKYNANQNNPIGATSFSKDYDSGQRVNIYQRMMKMFSEGWIPNQDPIWLEEFGDYNW